MNATSISPRHFFFLFTKLLSIANPLGPVWYMCLKTENCCLKTFMEIRMGEKVY